MIDYKSDRKFSIESEGADHDAASEPGPRGHRLRKAARAQLAVARLTGLGIPGALAEVNADHLDWHQVARLVQRGCPRGWPCASPADERTRKLARRRLPPRRPGSLPGSTRKGLFPLDAESFPAWLPAAARQEGIDMTSGVTDTPRSGRPPAAGGVAWHTLGADQVPSLRRGRRRRGLSSAEAAARAQRPGPNKLAAGKAEPP